MEVCWPQLVQESGYVRRSGKGMDDLKPKSASQDDGLTYLFRVLGERVVHLDGFLDHVLIGDLEEGEADDLGHLDGCWF
jgi:hypothetical protein